MIEEIKQALENATEGEWKDDDQDTAYSAEVFTYAHGIHNPIARGMRPADAQLVANIKPWLRYLLGEVERLEKEKSNVHDWREKAAREASQLRGQVEKLQKALEWYAERNNYQMVFDDNDPFEIEDSPTNKDEGERARTALQSIQGGNTT